MQWGSDGTSEIGWVGRMSECLAKRQGFRVGKEGDTVRARTLESLAICSKTQLFSEARVPRLLGCVAQGCCS